MAKEDGQLLWADALALIEATDMQPATIAMLRSCEVEDFSGDTLTISTGLGFARMRIQRESETIERLLEEAAFQPIHLVVELTAHQHEPKASISNEITQAEAQDLQTPAVTVARAARAPAPMTPNLSALLDDPDAVRESKLTFERFVAGEENMLAFEAAKQVANGENKGYNPLFIFGKSGLGKTHLLRAIQNYIVLNDSSRTCSYRTAAEFVEDYRIAWNDKETSARSALSTNYQSVDVLIIDDVQNMSTAAGSIRFFFETFNALMSHGKQIVLAADRSPLQLGMGESKFDERETSRMDSGVTVSIQVPDYELKLNLINTFYERMKQDAEREHIGGMSGNISKEMRQLMAERAGANIRTMEGFVQTCIINATRLAEKGQALGKDDIIKIAAAKWPSAQRTISIEQIQKAVESYYDVSHDDLVGAKRNKEVVEPRHVCIWLVRELTDNTLADIGKRFGGRSHATVKHSIKWVETTRKEDRIFLDHLESIKDSIIAKS